ncbi:MAG: tRNA (guanosine(46)-N7)-methyltransferase TrmB [Lachnospiraceae bacterium]|nr:tRNA (guanosine(46)-N7)-methyltransferase TrmB [Lachnospiraceae bacterium]
MRLRNIPEAKGIVAESAHVIHLTQENGADLSALSGGNRPLHMEIGMGKGAFVIAMALAHPENFYIGVERYESVLMRAVQKMDALKGEQEALQEKDAFMSGQESLQEKDALMSGQESLREDGAPGKNGRVFPENLKFLCEDAAKLPDLFPAGSVEKLYLNFSDPWPKARHEKRRLTSEYFLSIYERFLKPGGELIFKTDNTGLFEFSVETMQGAERWTMKTVTRDLHHTLQPGEENIMTEYERKFSNLGSKICRMTAVFNG